MWRVAKKAIWSLRLRLHSGLRQSGKRLLFGGATLGLRPRLVYVGPLALFAGTLRCVDHVVDFDGGAPEAETDVAVGGDVGEVQLAPAMEAYATVEAGEGVGFVLAVGPEAG